MTTQPSDAMKPMLTPDPAAEFFLIPDHLGAQFGELIRLLHHHLRPRTYFEIGTLAGGTLRLANCASIAIDVKFEVDQNVLGSKPSCFFMQMSSDSFFADYDPTILLKRPIDLAFLDGMHFFEFLLRDFMNTERYCERNSVILLHDCLPTDSHVARRELGDTRFEHLSPHPDWWAGDVWKTAMILKKYRPGLRIHAFDSAPTGLIAITDLDPKSAVLEKHYPAIVEQFHSACLTQRGIQDHMSSLNVSETAVFQQFDALSRLLRVGIFS